MASILDEICKQTLEDLKIQKREVPLSALEAQAKAASSPRSFYEALENSRAQQRFGLIAEIKHKSPSHGVIRADFDPASIAVAYQDGGAACLSVLTNAPYFGGAPEFLTAARDATALPVLRKDFILDPYQVIETRAMAADGILLILAALSQTQAHELEAAAFEYGLDVLVEVHDARELEWALAMKSAAIGINNRNLKTLEIDLNTAIVLAKEVPEDRLVVAESGLTCFEDLQKCGHEAGITTFLVGEALMRQNDIEAATRRLLTGFE